MSWMREPGAEPIPGYSLIEPLGAGGFGEVWKCVAPGGILKAIKFVYGNLQSEDVDAVRAEQEQKALEKVKLIRHPKAFTTASSNARRPACRASRGPTCSAT